MSLFGFGWLIGINWQQFLKTSTSGGGAFVGAYFEEEIPLTRDKKQDLTELMIEEEKIFENILFCLEEKLR